RRAGASGARTCGRATPCASRSSASRTARSRTSSPPHGWPTCRRTRSAARSNRSPTSRRTPSSPRSRAGWTTRGADAAPLVGLGAGARLRLGFRLGFRLRLRDPQPDLLDSPVEDLADVQADAVDEDLRALPCLARALADQLVQRLHAVASDLDAVELGQLGDRRVPAQRELDGLRHRARRLGY